MRKVQQNGSELLLAGERGNPVVLEMMMEKLSNSKYLNRVIRNKRLVWPVQLAPGPGRE